MEELDRILDRDHVHAAVLVDVVDHRGERGGFARAGDAGDQDEPARLERDLLEHHRQVQLADGLDLVRNGAERERERAALLVDVGAKPADARHADGEVRFLLLGELLDLPGSHHLLRQHLEILRLDRRHLERLELAVEPNRGRPPYLEQEVGCVALHHLGDGVLEVEGRRRRGGRRAGRRGLSHWDRPGRGPDRTRPAGRRPPGSRAPRRRSRPRSRS